MRGGYVRQLSAQVRGGRTYFFSSGSVFCFLWILFVIFAFYCITTMPTKKAAPEKAENLESGENTPSIDSDRPRPRDLRLK